MNTILRIKTFLLVPRGPPWGRALTHGVAVRVVLQGVLPDEVGVAHKLVHRDVLLLVDVGQQRGEVHRRLHHQSVVRHLERDAKEEEEGREGEEHEEEEAA